MSMQEKVEIMVVMFRYAAEHPGTEEKIGMAIWFLAREAYVEV